MAIIHYDVTYEKGSPNLQQIKEKLDQRMGLRTHLVKDSIEAGGRGVSIGRNVFQHNNIVGITRAIVGIVLDNLDVEEAMKFLQ